MTTIAILLEEEDRYRALAGDKESTGRTPGEALDAITSQLSDAEGDTLVIVQEFKPDEFFDAAQQERLTELMQLREARVLSQDEERELEGLVEAELDGARLRAESKLKERRRASDEVWRQFCVKAMKSPNSAAMTKEEVAELLRTTRGLNGSQMELVYLKYVLGFSDTEIAAELNKNVTFIRHELNRLHAKLRPPIRKRLKKSERVDGESEDTSSPDARKA